jgi:hypothetical protein
MSGRTLVFGGALAALLAAVAGEPAAAANWVEQNFYLKGPSFEGILPACDEPAALGKIASRFSDKEWMYWNSPLTITGYDHVREVAFRPWAANTIPRRFCTATIFVSNGNKYILNYAIGEDTSMIGITWGVDWCVVGLDRNWAYNPACKMAQP